MDGATSTLRERGRGAAHDLASEPLGLLAGLVAAACAWWGVSQRLEEYR